MGRAVAAVSGGRDVDAAAGEGEGEGEGEAAGAARVEAGGPSIHITTITRLHSTVLRVSFSSLIVHPRRKRKKHVFSLGEALS